MYKECKQYKDHPVQSVIRLEDNVCIGFGEDNPDYVRYLKWLAEGNQPLPADE